MNLKTTLVLLVLAALGGLLFWLGPAALVPVLAPQAQPPQPAGATLAFLQNDLTRDNLTRIEVRRGDRVVVLERGPGGVWSLPGKWPARQPEAQELVGQVTGLRSRFAALPAADAEALKAYGLDQPAVTVTVKAGGEEHRLAFSEHEPPTADATTASANRFSRPTYLRLDDNSEVVRLAPGLVGELDKPLAYYQQRRLFPAERVAKDADSQEKVERLAARAVTVEEKKEGGSTYTLTKAGTDWELTTPMRDRPDPDKLKAILTAVPDVWAEQFVENPKADLTEYGLKEPEQTLRVTTATGEVMTLLVGKTSPTVRERTVVRPSPPGVPAPPLTDVIKEEFRYAKLQDNDQVFEIKADKLKELFVPLDTVRDARLARFRADDATRLEIAQAGQKPIIFTKDKGRWRIEEPLKADAESTKVTELLDKLSGLQARDKDVIDKADPKTYGLDTPAATVKVTVEEEEKTPATGGHPPAGPESKDKKKTTKTFTLLVGKQDADKGKLYVRVDGWDRVNAVETALASLVDRPALAYRGRRVFDFAIGDVEQLKVQRSGETVALKKADGKWALAEPVAAEADAGKSSQLVSSLSGLEAVEYAADAVKPEDLDKEYGLAKPELTATLTFGDKDKPAQTLQVGKQRGTKPEFFARLADKDSVFVVKKEFRDALDQGSLAYRPLQFPELAAEDVKDLRVAKEGQDEYRVARKDDGWRVTAPFEAAAVAKLVAPMLEPLAHLRAERYEAHAAKEPEKFGLDKPSLKLTLTTSRKEGDKEENKERTLLVGKAPDKDPAARYAKLADADAVFVVGPQLMAAVDKGALDLLDRRLVTVDRDGVERLRSTAGAAKLALEKQKDGWRVVESPAEPFAADALAVESVLNVWFDLVAQRYAAYGPKADLAKFGLDKPEASVTVTVKKVAEEGKPAATEEHTLHLGKEVEGSPGSRYAKLDKGEGVAVLAPNVVRELTRTYLDFVSRTVLEFDAEAVTALVRQKGPEAVEVVKRDGDWQITKPADQKADERTVQDVLRQLTQKAVRVAAYPAKDLKEFGLDQPAAVVTVRLAGADGKTTEHVLKVGKAVEGGDAAGQHFAQADGSKTVVVLAKPLADRLLAPPVGFRDRSLARFVDADKAVVERRNRKAVFAKVDGTWKLTEALEADAEHTELENLINVVARLQASELVAEKPTADQLKEYGLDKPEAHWRFQSGDKDVLSLVLGAREKGGRRVYGKLESGDVVFLLEPALSDRLFAEYRSRTIWAPSLDASQAEALTYTRGNTSFVLEKTETGWQVAGKPDVKVNADAVSDALAAIAGLKVERYVIDKGAQLKLYGLDPAELKIEVQTRTGKRTLLVGREPEGEAKRYYAHVPEKERTDVFVIAEADAARIGRDLPAFTQAPAKAEKPAP